MYSNTTNAQNTGAPKPDFRYPEQVATDAEQILHHSIQSGDDLGAIDALIRLAVVQQLKGEEGMPAMLKRIHQYADSVTKPDAKALTLLLEAKMYQQYYNNCRWEIRNRTVPEGDMPEDITEWGHKQFETYITSLLTDAQANLNNLKALPLKNYSRIIDRTDCKYLPTLADFILYQSIELAQEIPLDTKAEWIKEIMQSAEGNRPMLAFLDDHYCEGRSNAKQLELYEKYRDIEECAFFLEKISIDKDDWRYEVANEGKTSPIITKQGYYTLLNDYLKRFPKSQYLNNIKNCICKVERMDVVINYPAIATSGAPIKVTVRSSNSKKVILNVFRVKDYQRHNTNATLKRKDAKPIHTVEVDFEDAVPFDTVAEKEATIPALDYGTYVIIPDDSQKRGFDDEVYYRYNGMIRVSDITLYTVASDKDWRVIAVNPITGKPLKDVLISTFITGHKGYLTDDNGVAVIPYSKNKYTFWAVNGKDTAAAPVDEPWERGKSEECVNLRIFTDLNIYRPGETIKYAVVTNQLSPSANRLCSGYSIFTALYDANNRQIATDSLTTDDSGRVTGSFSVPTDCLGGSFRIFASTIAMNKPWQSNHRIEVSEYKAPTFEITFPDEHHSYKKDADVTVQGKCVTYTGMPVADQKVTLALSKSDWWLRWFNFGGSDDFVTNEEAVTDAEGNFTITFPASLFVNEEQRSRYTYSLTATVTNAEGETRSAETTWTIGSYRDISMDEDVAFINNAPVKLPITFRSSDETETAAKCSYTLKNRNDEKVAEGSFMSDAASVDWQNLPSGTYHLEVKLSDDTIARGINTKVMLYKPTDTTSPSDKALWADEKHRSVDKQHKAHITLGIASADTYVYYTAQSNTKVISQGWKKYDAGIHDFSLPMPTGRNETLRLELLCVRDSKVFSYNATFESPINNDPVTLKITSFRDLTSPGAKEKWQLSFVDKDGKPRQGFMLLRLYNKALDALVQSPWSTLPQSSPISIIDIKKPSITGDCRQRISWQAKWLKQAELLLPVLNFYDMGYIDRGVRFYKSASPRMLSMSLNRVNNAVFYDEDNEANASVDCAYAMASASGAGSYDEGIEVEEEAKHAMVKPDFESIELRTEMVKSALWMPMLATDAEGNFVVEFNAPNDASSWVMQALAYDNFVGCSTASREMVTRKPVMARLNAPRFVRNADVATLFGSVQNATDESITADALIEVFDPRTDAVLAQKQVHLTIGAKGTEQVSIDYTVEAQTPMLGLRLRATNGNFSDGEQRIFPVLAAESAVIEATPFYINPKQSEFTVKLPKMPSDSRATLEYCNNPAWYCAMALPTMVVTDSKISTTLAHSLWALGVAKGIADEQPHLKEGIKHYLDSKGDSTLISMLEKNPDLKYLDLKNSPWLEDAQSQTLSMSQLAVLFDNNATDKKIGDLISKLQSMQHRDGGFPWFEYHLCYSSLYITEEIAELIGELYQLGYLKDNPALASIAKKAVAFIDAENLEIYKDALKNEVEDFCFMADYAYIRSLFPTIKMTNECKKMYDRILHDVELGWGAMSLDTKAFVAMTLHRNGKHDVATQITESLRQFASHHPVKGMYWDSVRDSYYYNNRQVRVTAVILEALAEIDNRRDEIDDVRRWLLLEKQANDWGQSSLASHAIYSVLLSGTEWLGATTTPSITIGGKSIAVPTDDYLGYGRIALDPTQVSDKELAITGKGQQPAWGSVFLQYKAPMKEIKAQATPEISIKKEFLVHNPDGTYTRTDKFEVGQRVEVHLVVKCLRNAAYIDIVDERAACFEPKNQISGYWLEGDTYYYIDTKDAETHLFLYNLPRGTHVFRYEVYVTNPGQFSAGVASLQCHYAPHITAHSAAEIIKVKP